MAKDKDIIEKLSSLEDKVANIEFLVVQMMGGGGPASTSVVSAPSPTGSVNVDLTPVKETLERMESSLISKADLQGLQSEFKALTSGKIKQSEDVINKATLLLEKGLQMTELETTLLEIKDRLDELIVHLSSLEEKPEQ